jgi:hypothetical protein
MPRPRQSARKDGEAERVAPGPLSRESPPHRTSASRPTATRDASSRHVPNGYLARKPNFAGIDLKGVDSTIAPNLTWGYVGRLRDRVRARLVLKGILAAEDARLAVDKGVDAIIVSNHGGRAEDGGGSTIEALPEIIDAVAGRIPVLVDSGFRRGSDIVKALAIGARRVHRSPRPVALGAFGQAGLSACWKSCARRCMRPCNSSARHRLSASRPLWSCEAPPPSGVRADLYWAWPKAIGTASRRELRKTTPCG